MVPAEIWTVKELFCYPNEQIFWSVLIVLYPFMTGLVAGSFVYSSLYYAFRIQALKEMSSFALVFSLALLAAAPLPLLFHLEQPARCFNIILTPHFTSAMSVFGFVFFAFSILCCVQIWFVYRKHFVQRALYFKNQAAKSLINTSGFFINALLALGAFDCSQKALSMDEKAARILSILGIPAAFFLTGYTGFIFGSMKANPLWMTPLMPVIFVLSGMASGAALCLYTYTFALKIWNWCNQCRKSGKAESPETALQLQESVRTDSLLSDEQKEKVKAGVQLSARYMLGALVAAFTLELLDLVTRQYASIRSFDIISELIYKRDFCNIFILQYGIGNVIPVLLLALPRLTPLRAVLSSLLVLFGVFMMRWNVVIGAQSISYTLAGYMHYVLPIVPSNLETLKDGLGGALFIVSVPFLVLWLLSFFFPLFDSDKSTESRSE